MNYTKLISKKKQYKYSVNICFDLRNEDRLADFIPNITTTEIIREYLGGIIRGKEFHFIGLDAIYDYFELNIKTFKTDESYGIYKKLQYALNKLGLDDDG